MDAAGEFLFGSKEFNTLDQPLPVPSSDGIDANAAGADQGPYGESVIALQEIIALRSISGRWWAMREFWKDDTIGYNKFVDRFVLPLVQKALDNKMLRGEKKCDVQEGNLVDHMADTTSNVKLIRDEVSYELSPMGVLSLVADCVIFCCKFNLLIAARDTTAAMLTFTVYLLSLHPEILVKLRKEVVSIVPSGPPTFDDMRKMPPFCEFPLFPSLPAPSSLSQGARRIYLSLTSGFNPL
jgi:hypothetical protein